MAMEILEFKTKPIMSICRCSQDIERLVESSKKLSNNKEFVLLIDPSKKAIERTLPAYLNASIRMGEGIARSNSMQIEMLLFICGTMNIGKALKEFGAKNPKEFLVFATQSSLFDKFAKPNHIKVIKRINLQMDSKVAKEVAMTELMSE